MRSKDTSTWAPKKRRQLSPKKNSCSSESHVSHIRLDMWALIPARPHLTQPAGHVGPHSCSEKQLLPLLCALWTLLLLFQAGGILVDQQLLIYVHWAPVAPPAPPPALQVLMVSPGSLPISSHWRVSKVTLVVLTIHWKEPTGQSKEQGSLSSQENCLYLLHRVSSLQQQQNQTKALWARDPRSPPYSQLQTKILPHFSSASAPILTRGVGREARGAKNHPKVEVRPDSPHLCPEKLMLEGEEEILEF
ncbi:hypothetical protein CB1_000904020 [Camelus ferus]|nr:hypothetical protein CB1_000904020 [Camelus ferus]